MSRDPLLPHAVPVAFADLDQALGRLADERRRGGSPALTATVVVVGPEGRLGETAPVLEELAGSVGIRPILISTGDRPQPQALVSGHAIALTGVRPSFVNNAVAALRLSSLPTLVWWRGGEADALDDLAELCDRLVLDAEDPAAAWDRVLTITDRTAVSDLRWTRLTRWRALMAHFFDIPEVRTAAQGFQQLHVEGSDRDAMRLYVGWMKASLRLDERVAFQLTDAPAAPPLRAVRFGNGSQELTLRLAPSGRCVQTGVRVEGHAAAARTVSLGIQDLPSLVAEELRVRSRDLAFEAALQAARHIA